MNNTYAIRTKLKVPSRHNSQLLCIRQSRSTLPQSNLEVVKVADIVHRALPTIPIMKYISDKPTSIMQSPLKAHINITSSKTNNVIKPEVPRKLLTELMIGELDREPATHSSPTEFTHKIIRHRRPLLKKLH